MLYTFNKCNHVGIGNSFIALEVFILCFARIWAILDVCLN